MKVALFFRLEAKLGKEKNAENFPLNGLPVVQNQPATTVWFGIRIGPSATEILDAPPVKTDRQVQITSQVSVDLIPKTGELFLMPARIKRIDILA